jgi:hypothetical protein
LWALLVLLSAPGLATLHTLSHIVHATPVSAWTFVDQDPDDAPDAGDHSHTDAHCHTCDEWQALNHALPSMPVLVPTRISLPLPPPAPMQSAATARAPWILPRAPPSRALATVDS